MITITTTIEENYSKILDALYSTLDGGGKKDLHDAAGSSVAELLRGHIGEYAQTHHKTAREIRGGPATPTGHLEEAAKSVKKESVTDSEALITVRSPGMRRALGSLTIYPDQKQWLTVAVHAMAYGETVGTKEEPGTLRKKYPDMKIFRPKGRDFLGTTDASKNLIVLYVLKQRVTLPHEPELIPTGKELVENAKEGVQNRLKEIIIKKRLV
jgi:hypothetical protein